MDNYGISTLHYKYRKNYSSIVVNYFYIVDIIVI